MSEYVELFGYGLRVVTTDAAPADRLILMPQRQAVDVHQPDGTVQRHAEPLDAFARRCVVLATPPTQQNREEPTT